MIFKTLPFLLFVILITGCKKEEEELRVSTPQLPAPCEPFTDFEKSIIQDINQYSMPFGSAVPNQDFEELEPFGALISDTDAQIVGLGEATHGSKEFFQMKHRIFQYLVEQHGFRAIGFEATWGGSLIANDYVQGKRDDLEYVMDALVFWTWDTQEVRELLKWMRAYNATKPNDQKIFFYGFDCQSIGEEMKMINRYLEKVEPLWANTVDSLYSIFAPYTNYNYRNFSNDNLKSSIRDNLNMIYNTISANRADYIALSDTLSYELALQAARVIIQAEQLHSGEGARDDMMVDNTHWIRDFIGNDAKIALWAHDLHVTKADNWKKMGASLKTDVNYIAVGFRFSNGRFNALKQWGNNGVGLLNVHSYDFDYCGTTGHVFKEAEADNFYLDFSKIPENSNLFEWFNTIQKYNYVGSTYKPSNWKGHFLDFILAEHFDVLIHFDNITESEF